MVAEDGGHFDEPERGIAYQISGKTWVNNHAHILRPKAGLDIRFLTRVLENYDIRPFISGTTRGKLTKGQAEKIEIPLPPLEEQKRIAAILDQADALRRLRARALDRLNALGQAIFHEMFGDCVANAKGFQNVTVEDVIAGFETGKNLAEDPDGGQPGAVRVLKISAVTSGLFKPHESKPLPSDYIPPASHFVREGDLLFSRANTEELIGATAIVNEKPKNLVLPQIPGHLRILRQPPDRPDRNTPR